MPENYISKVKLPGDETIYDIRAHKTAGIYYAQVDSTSTSTKFTATIDDLNIDAYYDGLTVLLYNGKVTSASGFTININGLGAKPSYSNMTLGNPVTPTDPTRDTTIFNINYAMLFTYNSTRVSGGCWICYRGYDANTNTIGYQLRTNNTTMPTTDKFYRYRLLFTSADHNHWVPANTSTSTNATAKRDTIQRPIDPFGEIVWYGTTTAIEANANVAAAQLWQEYYGSYTAIGYSFNRTGAAQTMTANRPIYIKCAPQSDGSAIIDADTPYVQALPNSEDGKIYIYLGRAYNATNFEILMNHPVYYYKDGAIRLWSNAAVAGNIPTKTSDLTNDGDDGTHPFLATDDVVSTYSSSGTAPVNGTAVAAALATLPGGTVTNIATGSGLTGGPISSTGTISHADTSTQASSTNSGRTYIQSVGLDDFGHVTSLSTATETTTDTTYTFANGTNSFTVTPSGGSAQTVTVTPSVDASSQLTGVVPLTNGGTGIAAASGDTWYTSDDLHPHFEVVWGDGIYIRYCGPMDGISSINSALVAPQFKQALVSVVPVVHAETGMVLFTGTILPSMMDENLSYIYVLFPDAVYFQQTIVNGVSGQLIYDSQEESIYVPASSLQINQPYWYTSWRPTLYNDTYAGSIPANKTLATLSEANGIIDASIQDIAITSDQVTRNATDATIATNDKLGIFDANDSNKLKGSSITFDTTETGTYLRRDGTWATPPSGGNRVVYTAYCDSGEVGIYQGTITLDDSKTGADIISDIESGNQVVIQVEDVEANTYEFTYSGARDNSTYVFTYVAHNSTNSQTALIITAATVTLKQSAYMELVSNRVSSITSSSLTTTYPNTKTVYDAISGGAISHYKLSTMDIEVSANYQTITINDIVGGFDCAVGDIVIGRNGNYGHIVSWSTSANPHSGTILYDGYLDDQIWSKSSSNGVYYPSVISSDDSNLANGSLSLFSGSASQAIGAKTGQASLNLQAYTLVSLNASHAAGSTSYTLNNATLGPNADVSYLSNIYFYTTQHYTALKPTTVTASGVTATITFTESLNPTSAVSQLAVLNYDAGAFSILAGSGAYNAGYANVNVGTLISNTGHYSVVGGNKNSNSGQDNIIGGNRNKVTGHYDVVSGQSNLVTVSRALISGLGHDTTNGPANTAAVGAYSSISSDTAFAVGIGTADDARANAFEVHTDGRATIATAPTANMDVANKSYVDNSIAAAASSHTHGNVTNDGKIGTTANYAVYTTTGGALTASAALPTAITNATIAALPVWSATPTDTTYFIRQDTGGANSFGRVAFSTVNNYIKTKNPVLNYVTYDSTEDAIKFVFPS